MMLGCIPLAAAVVAWDGQVEWSGQGIDSLRCDKLGESPERTEAGWMHWIVTQAGNVEDAELVLGGSGSGAYEPTKYGPVIEFFTPYYDVDELEATLHYEGTLDVNSQLVLSDYCPGENGNGGIEEIPEFPTIALPIAAILGLAFFFQRRKE
ncbi:MAG: PEF-CTERM sorting domain-containing protein [Methanolobus sp.]|nr:PEF-CTERM sorting domain-containing protein [Methanolobus sp.]